MRRVIENLVGLPGQRRRRSQKLVIRGVAPLCLVLLAFSVRVGLVMTPTQVDLGEWKTLPYLMPINPIHAGLLRDGRVLIIAGSENEKSKHDVGISRAAVWDPQTGTITVQNLPWDLFCNGMVFLPDGRTLIIGGTTQYDSFTGEARASIFDPATDKFIEVQSTTHGRWYATGTLLSDGHVMAFSGLDERARTNAAVEIYAVASGWSPEYPAPWTPPLYPRLHLLPNGRVFYSGSTPDSHLFDPVAQTWTLNVARTNYAKRRTAGASVLLPLLPGYGYAPRVMILGGDNPATATTEAIDLSIPTPRWHMTPAMSAPRIQMSAVLLPNGKVLALGGSSVDGVPRTASLSADLFDPATETMAPAGVATYPRLYHSVALLLPDATVWVAGSNPVRGTYEPHMEIYSPPYLFALDASGQAIPATRPRITGAPAIIGYQEAFQVETPDSADIGSVALLRPGSATHAFDMDQRMVGLSFVAGSGGTLTVAGPPDDKIAPPGYYMLFILNGAGVPSIARFVQISAVPTNQSPKGTITAPTDDPVIQAGEAVTFAGTGNDPDSVVSGYSWIFPDGIPGTSAAQNPGAITFSEPGSHVVSLTVFDDLGANDPSPATRIVTVVSPPLVVSFISPQANATVRGIVSVNVRVSGAAGVSNTFTLAVDGKMIGTKIAGTSTAFTWNTARLARGPHLLTATVKDANGNKSMASESVIVKN